MELSEALWLVGELFGKELHKARHSLNEDRAEELEGAIGVVEGELYQLSAGWAESFLDGVKSGTPSLTKDKDGVIISKGG